MASYSMATPLLYLWIVLWCIIFLSSCKHIAFFREILLQASHYKLSQCYFYLLHLSLIFLGCLCCCLWFGVTNISLLTWLLCTHPLSHAMCFVCKILIPLPNTAATLGNPPHLNCCIGHSLLPPSSLGLHGFRQKLSCYFYRVQTQNRLRRNQ